MNTLDYITKRSKVTDGVFNVDANVRTEFDTLRAELIHAGKILLVSGCIIVSGMSAYGGTADNVYSDYRGTTNDRGFSENNVRYLEEQARLASRTAGALGNLRKADASIRQHEAYFEGSDPSTLRPELPRSTNSRNFVGGGSAGRGSAPGAAITYINPEAVALELKNPRSTISRLHKELKIQKGFTDEDLKLGARFSGGVALLVDKSTQQPAFFTVDSNNVLLIVNSDPDVEMSEQVAAVLYIRQLPADQRADRFRLIVADRAAKVARNDVLANTGPSGP